eukprot:4057876-Prorocentrum_lima.AAC.1
MVCQNLLNHLHPFHHQLKAPTETQGVRHDDAEVVRIFGDGDEAQGEYSDGEDGPGETSNT